MTTYDYLLGDLQNAIKYIDGAPATDMYPHSNLTSVFGPIWTPRIYGKDLTSFEIASSGAVAISLKDIHSFDFTMKDFDNGTQKNTMAAQSNYSMEFTANQGELQLLMDANSNNIYLKSKSNLDFQVLNGSWTNFVSSNMSLVINNDNILTVARHSIEEIKGNFTNVTNSNYNVATVAGCVHLSAYNSNTVLTLCEQDISLYSASNTNFSISNNLNINVAKSVTENVGLDFTNVTQASYNISTVSGPINLSANSDKTSIQLGNSNIIITASNDVKMVSGHDFIIDIAGSMSNNVIGSIYEQSTASIESHASASYDITAGTGSVIIKGTTGGSTGGSKIELGSNLDVQSGLSINMSACNELNIIVNSNVSEHFGADLVNVTTSNYNIATVAGALNLSANSSNTYVKLGLNDINIYSASNTSLTINKDLTETIGGTVYESIGNEFNNVTQSNYNVATVAGCVHLSAYNSNTFITLCEQDISLYSASNTNVSVSNNLNIDVAKSVSETVGLDFKNVTQCNYNIDTVAGHILLAANSLNTTFELSKYDVNVYSASNTNFTVSNNYNVNVDKSLTETVGSNITITATTGSYLAQADNNKMFLSMNANTDELTLSSKSNVIFKAGSDISITASNDMHMSAAHGNVLLNADNASIELNGIDHTLSLYSASNTMLTQSNNLIIHTNNNTSFSNNNSGSFGVSVPKNILLSASNNLSYVDILGGTTNSVVIYGLSNVNQTAGKTIDLRAGDQILAYSSNDMIFSACNDLFLNAKGSVYVNYQTINFNGSNGAADFIADSNISFYIRSSEGTIVHPTFNVGTDCVRIEGDMFISGNITSSNVYNTTVMQNSVTITDKTITLAMAGSNSASNYDGQIDGQYTNSGAGIIIDGFPAGLTNSLGTAFLPGDEITNDMRSAYEKSLTWHHNTTGMADLGTNNLNASTSEATWELVGGQLKLIYVNPVNGMKTAFGFRVNATQELELVKHYCTNQKIIPNNTDPSLWNYGVERVAKFGRLLNMC